MKNIVERVVSRGLDIKVNDFLLFEIMNVCYSINEENLGNSQFIMDVHQPSLLEENIHIEIFIHSTFHFP